MDDGTLARADGTERSEEASTPARRAGRGRVVGVVIVTVAALLGLAGWVYWAEYDSGPFGPAGSSFGCTTKFDIEPDADGLRFLHDFDRACEQAREDRRRTALVWGAGIVVVAAAASTWPSRRLTHGAASRADAASG